ncbi:MAG: hypothetical protein J3K34DRAFT_497886 [Monoraphidium minutum]|nr:MAG: hypothetical protein J3K34DRAFT_497886 [Monoraphidium minutum]
MPATESRRKRRAAASAAATQSPLWPFGADAALPNELSELVSRGLLSHLTPVDLRSLGSTTRAARAYCDEHCAAAARGAAGLRALYARCGRDPANPPPLCTLSWTVRRGKPYEENADVLSALAQPLPVDLLPNLVALRLDCGTFDVKSAAIRLIQAMLDSLSGRLLEIDLTLTNKNNDVGLGLLTAAAKHKGLRALRLRRCVVGRSAARGLAAIFKDGTWPHLQELQLPDVHGGAFAALATATHLTALTSLRLSHIDAKAGTPEQITRLAAAPWFPSLRRLTLGGGQQAGLASLAAASLPALEELTLFNLAPPGGRPLNAGRYSLKTPPPPGVGLGHLAAAKLPALRALSLGAVDADAFPWPGVMEVGLGMGDLAELRAAPWLSGLTRLALRPARDADLAVLAALPLPSLRRLDCLGAATPSGLGAALRAAPWAGGLTALGAQFREASRRPPRATTDDVRGLAALLRQRPPRLRSLRLSNLCMRRQDAVWALQQSARLGLPADELEAVLDNAVGRIDKWGTLKF